jgi:hypothetical protein
MTKPRPGRPGLDSGLRQGRDFSVCRSAYTSSGVHPASCSMGNGCSYPGREADHLPSSSAKDKSWNNNSTPQYVLMTWYLVSHRATLPLPCKTYLPLLYSLCYFKLVPSYGHGSEISGTLQTVRTCTCVRFKLENESTQQGRRPGWR